MSNELFSRSMVEAR